MKHTLLRSFLLFLFTALSVAAHPQGTYTAASANESDVNAVINGPTHVAINGDTIQIPCSGSQSVTWTTTLTVSASITITALGGSPNTGASSFGSGTNCLTILDNNPSGPIFNLTPTYAASNNVTVLQNINIDPYSGGTALWSPIFIIGTATSSGFPQARVDNIVFGKNTQWTESGNSSNAAWLIRQNDAIGVADHNTLSSGSSVEFFTGNFGSYLGVGEYGDNSWAQPDTMGGAINWFNENNLAYLGDLPFNDCEIADSFQGKGGCRVVNRFNHIYSNGAFQITAVHGLDTSGRPRSGRHTETYENINNCTSSGGCSDMATSYRGGTGVTWGNTGTVSGGAFYDQIFDITVYRTVYGNDPFGYCGGLNSIDPWDTNDNTAYYSGTVTSANGLTMTDSTKSFPSLTPYGAPYSVYDTTQGFVSEISSNTGTTITVRSPISESTWSRFNSGDSYQIIRSTVCVDQAGRGQGVYVSGDTPSPSSPMNEALDPIYEWDDSSSSIAQQTTSDTGRTIANRDYYTDNWKGGGLSGPAQQTSPSVPFNGSTTCNDGGGNYTCGVGFGTLANRPSTCTTGVGYWATDQGNWDQGGGVEGELFKCTATSTWTLSYTPYTYPHPLASGSTSTTTLTPTPPSNLNGTVIQ